MNQESIIRQAIETQKLKGYLISDKIWFKFREGKNAPRVSPWGAVLMTINADKNGNFHIPSGDWWQQVINHLGIVPRWLELFADGFDGEKIDVRWQSLLTEEESLAYSLGKRMAKEYLK